MLSARVETRLPPGEIPSHLWFSFPDDLVAAIPVRSDAFLASLFLMAMFLGEDLQVRGQVSPLLAENLPSLQEVYLRMGKGLFKPIAIQYETLQAPDFTATPEGVGTMYSGGIDSTYCLWSHLGANGSGEPRLTHGVFVHGFDILLHQQEYYDVLFARYAALFERQGLRLVSARTNAYHFSQFRLDWGFAHAGPLAGAPLALGGLFRHFYLPGSTEIKNGRVSDPTYYLGWLATETLTLQVHQPEVTRSAKLLAIMDWPEAQNHLRVCMRLDHPANDQACNRCEKCLEALTYLDMFGARQRFVNFTQPMSLGKFLRFGWSSLGFITYYAHDLPQRLRQRRRYGTLLLYWLLGGLNEVKNALYRRLLAWIPAPHRLRLKRRIFAAHLPPPGWQPGEPLGAEEAGDSPPA